MNGPKAFRGRSSQLLRITVVFVACLLAAQVACCATQIVNGGFETSGSGGALDSDSWIQFAFGNNAVSERSLSNPRTGAAAHRFFVDELNDAVSVLQDTATTGQPSLPLGSTVALEFWADADLSTPNFVARLTVSDANSILQAVTLIPSLDTNFGSYQLFDTTSEPIAIPLDAVAPVTALVDFEYLSPAPNGIAQEIFVDDARLIVTPVPEPAGLGRAAAVLMLLLLGHTGRPRK